MRAILFFILVLVVFFAINYLIKLFKTKPTRPGDNNSSHQNPTQQPASEQMVSCEVCQLHFPISQAISQQGKHFCSQQHLLEFQQQPKN